MNIAIVRPKHLPPPSVQIGVAPAALGKISYEIYIHRVPVSWLLGDLTAGEDLIGKMNCSSSAER
jgi:peptidoglycan/LPS O-acetylase OafA/YrhL